MVEAALHPAAEVVARAAVKVGLIPDRVGAHDTWSAEMVLAELLRLREVAAIQIGMRAKELRKEVVARAESWLDGEEPDPWEYGHNYAELTGWHRFFQAHPLDCSPTELEAAIEAAIESRSEGKPLRTTLAESVKGFARFWSGETANDERGTEAST